MMQDLLSGLDVNDVELFRRDFKLLMKLAVVIDSEYAEADTEIDFNMPTYEKYISLFDMKYPGIKVKLSDNVEKGFFPEIFIVKEKTARDAFFNSAAKITKIRALSSTGCLQKDTPEDESQVKREINKIKSKVCVQYFGLKAPTVLLLFNKSKNMVEVIYDKSTVCDESGPEFKVIAYYALKDNDFDRSIDLHPIGERLSANATGVDTSMGGKGPLR